MRGCKTEWPNIYVDVNHPHKHPSKSSNEMSCTHTLIHQIDFADQLPHRIIGDTRSRVDKGEMK
jgi:hypothetical protein